jgi:hypothetical protein
MILYMDGEYVFLFFLVMVMTCLLRINICMWHRDDNGKVLQQKMFNDGKTMFCCFVGQLDRGESARHSSLDISAVSNANALEIVRG